MPAVRRTPLMELFWRIHPWIYRASKGRVLGSAFGMPVLLLTTTGRRSGAPRTTPLMYVGEGESFVVVASYAGEPRHPAWLLNLRGQPRAQVQVGGDQVPVIAREAEGEERERLWSEFVARERGYAEYQRRTRRRIPVVVLDRIGGSA